MNCIILFINCISLLLNCITRQLMYLVVINLIIGQLMALLDGLGWYQIVFNGVVGWCNSVSRERNRNIFHITTSQQHSSSAPERVREGMPKHYAQGRVSQSSTLAANSSVSFVRSFPVPINRLSGRYLNQACLLLLPLTLYMFGCHLLPSRITFGLLGVAHYVASYGSFSCCWPLLLFSVG